MIQNFANLWWWWWYKSIPGWNTNAFLFCDNTINIYIYIYIYGYITVYMAAYLIYTSLRTLKAHIQKILLRLLLLNWVQNLLSSPLLSENVKVKTYKTIIFACGLVRASNLICDIKRRIQIISENRVPRRIFGPNKDKIIGGWKSAY
jgi:hypothetical protein